MNFKPFAKAVILSLCVGSVAATLFACYQISKEVPERTKEETMQLMQDYKDYEHHVRACESEGKLYSVSLNVCIEK